MLLLLGGLLPQLALAQTLPTFDLAMRVLAPIPPGGRPYAEGLAVDAAGNSYVSGHLSGPARFGTTTIPAGSGNAYVAKIDPAGNYRWIVPINANSNGVYGMPTLAVDAGGIVHVAGSFATATLTLGSTTLTNAGGTDLFVGRLDANGNWLSAVRAGGPGNEEARGLALDGSGNAYLTGHFTGTTTIGSTALASAGIRDLFVARLDAGGTWRWAVRGGGGSEDYSRDVAVDAKGHAYVTGLVGATGGQLGPFTLPGNAAFVAQLDAATGAYRRVTPVGGPTANYLFLQLAVDAEGSCYLAGSYLGTLRFGSFVLTSVGVGLSNEDVFVAKLDAAGTWQWASTAGGTSGELCAGVAVDARGSVYLAGIFRGPGSRFGAVTIVPQNSHLFHNDVFVAKLSPTGSWLWAVPGGGLQDDHTTGFALGPAATPHVMGDFFSPSMAFGALTVPGEATFAGSTFLARMQPNLLRIGGDSVLCAGGATQLTASTFATTVSYRWSTGAVTPGIVVTQPGTYTVTATFAGGYTLSESFLVRGSAPSVQITGGAGFLCAGTPRQLTAVAPGAASLSWSTGATTASITVTQPGTYTVTATYGPACTVKAQVAVLGNALRISGRAQLCPGQSTTLAAVPVGSPVVGYRWSTGATTPTLVVGQGGTYTLAATLADGCQLTATHTVGPPVAKVASVSGDTLICPGTTLVLTARNPDALAYRWNTGATTPTITVGQPGRYGVVLTYTGGCTSRDSLLVRPAPVAPVFTLGADTTLCLEQPLLLRAPAGSGPGVAWRWSDGSSGPTLAVREAGTYSLELRTRCDSRTVSRRVAFTSCLLIPNVITPNNDQRNDRFVVQGLTGGDWALTLYNRWGRQVYHAGAYRHDWGANAAPGGYYYLLRQNTTNATHKGWLEVLR